ncbi:unnamed protein product, partial [Mesorhabditis belari]|uniref:DDB1- and CUL4-associated factor 11 n=1 Tax=Mesorhabditis belari TaxID=2138241 RepID=A0AAF3J3L0_9BILA
MGLVWSIFVETPLQLFLEFGRPTRQIAEVEQSLLAQAAIIAAQERFVMDMGRMDIDSDSESDVEHLASSIDSDNEKRRANEDTESDDSDFSSDYEIRPSTTQPRPLQKLVSGCTAGSCPEALGRLRLDCMTSTGELRKSSNLIRAKRLREFGQKPITTAAEKGKILSSFLPNRRKIVAKVETKTFCSRYFNGDDVMTASQDGSIRFYSRKRSYENRYQLKTQIMVPAVSWAVLDVAVSPDSTLLAYGTWRDEVFVTPLRSYLSDGCFDQEGPSPQWQRISIGAEDLDRGGSAMALFQLKFSRDGTEILCGASSFHVYAIDVETKKTTLDLLAHEDDINAVCFGARNHLVFSAGDDGLCKVWDRRAMNESTQAAGVFAGHRDGITSIDARSDDRYVITNSKDQTIKLWDLRCFAKQSGIRQTRTSVQSQRWDYRWNQNPSFKVQELLPGDCSVMSFYGHVVRHTLIRARFSPQNTGSRFIYTGCATGKVLVYDIVTGEVATELPGHVAVVRECDWNEETNEITSSSWDGQVFSWKYDPRSSPNYNSMGIDEESCDEFYEPLIHKKQNKRKRCSKAPTAQKYSPIDPYDTDTG